MGYLGLDIDSLVREIKLIMVNNFGSEVTEDNFEERFEDTKGTILESFSSSIDDNREIVLEELREEERILP